MARRLISAAEGEGPVNALDLALRKDLGKYQRFIEDLELVDFRVRIFQGGTDAVTRVLIEFRDGSGRELVDGWRLRQYYRRLVPGADRRDHLQAFEVRRAVNSRATGSNLWFEYCKMNPCGRPLGGAGNGAARRTAVEIGRIENRVAARAVERLMGQIAQFVDEETDLSDVDEMARADLGGTMQLAVDQPHQQGFIARLFGSATDRRRFGGGPEGIGWRRSQGGELLRHRDLLPLAGRSLAPGCGFCFGCGLGGRLRLRLVERLGIGFVVGEFLRLRGRRRGGGLLF